MASIGEVRRVVHAAAVKRKPRNRSSVLRLVSRPRCCWVRAECEEHAKPRGKAGGCPTRLHTDPEQTTAAFWQHWQPKASLLLNLGALHLAAPPAPTTFRTHPSPVNVITASPTTETSDQLQTRLDSDPGALDSSFTISPFFVLALSMHALLIIEYITMLVEDSIVSSTLANPRADETTPPTKSESLQSYCRRWTGELRGALGQNPGEAATLLVLCAALVYIAGWIGGDLDVKLSSRSSILLVKLEVSIYPSSPEFP